MSRSRIHTLACALLPLLSGGINAADNRNAAAEASAAAEISADYMRGVIVELSDDKYAGRGPGSAGDAAARAWMVREMAAMGLEPGAGNGEWEQPFELVSLDAEQPPQWTFFQDDKRLTLNQWDNYIVHSGAQQSRAMLNNAELVFVGYGIQAPEYDWDDFKGVDLTGKVLVMMNNDPDWDPALFEGNTRLWYGRWDYKYWSAANQGAAGVIIIHTQPSAGYLFQVVQTSWSGEQFELQTEGEARTQVNAWLTEDSVRELFALADLDLDALREAARSRDFRPVPLGITTSLNMPVTMDRATTANVLGLIPGGDPNLADEVVVFTAHHDHLGVGIPNDAGDAIYNGAMDNAAGVAQLLAIARAIQALPVPPRRSILFAFVGAEEQGLLGSQYYAEHPTFAPGKMAANINYDGGNIWGLTRDVTYIGLGKTTMDEILIRHAGDQGREVLPDQFPDRGYFYRSDQFNFARIGVPAMFVEAGTDFIGRPEGWGKEQVDIYTDRHYHQPSDEYDDSWNFEGMIQDALLGFYTGLEIANADEMPTWVPGDEFEAARQAALADVENP